MTTHYTVMSVHQAVQQSVPSANDWACGDRFEDEYRYAVVEITDQMPVRILGCDGGEPEDQTLTRDWAWVVDELNKAYHKGYEDGRRAND